MALVFVYGTLKRGDIRSGLLKNEKFLGEAVTVAAYRMVDCGSYPGLVEATQDGLAIEGEFYNVSLSCLARLDEEEGVDIGLYERRLVQLQPPFAEQNAEAYFYLGDCDGLRDCGVRWEVRR